MDDPMDWEPLRREWKALRQEHASFVEEFERLHNQQLVADVQEHLAFAKRLEEHSQRLQSWRYSRSHQAPRFRTANRSNRVTGRLHRL